MRRQAKWWKDSIRRRGAGPNSPAGNNMVAPVEIKQLRGRRRQTLMGLTRLPGGVIQDPAVSLAYNIRHLLGHMPPSQEDKDIAAQIKARVMARRKG